MPAAPAINQHQHTSSARKLIFCAMHQLEDPTTTMQQQELSNQENRLGFVMRPRCHSRTSNSSKQDYSGFTHLAEHCQRHSQTPASNTDLLSHVLVGAAFSQCHSQTPPKMSSTEHSTCTNS